MSTHSRTYLLHGTTPGPGALAWPRDQNNPILGGDGIKDCRQRSPREPAPHPWPERRAGGPTPGRFLEDTLGAAPSPCWRPEGTSRRSRGQGWTQTDSGPGGESQRRGVSRHRHPDTPSPRGGAPPVPGRRRGREEEQVTSPAVPGCPRRRRQPGRVTRARQWPGGLRGDAEGPRSTATAPPPRVRTAESGGEQAPAHWPTCRAGRARTGRRASDRARERGATDPAAAAAALLSPEEPAPPGPGPGRTPPQQEVPYPGRGRSGQGDPAALRPRRPSHSSPRGRGRRGRVLWPAGTLAGWGGGRGTRGGWGGSGGLGINLAVAPFAFTGCGDLGCSP